MARVRAGVNRMKTGAPAVPRMPMTAGAPGIGGTGVAAGMLAGMGAGMGAKKTTPAPGKKTPPPVKKAAPKPGKAVKMPKMSGARRAAGAGGARGKR